MAEASEIEPLQESTKVSITDPKEESNPETVPEPHELNAQVLQRESDVPPDIKFNEIISNIDCHPHRNLVVAGLITGETIVSSFDVSGNEELLNLSHHKKCCRAVKFSHDGNLFFSGSKDKSLAIIDTETGSLIHTFNSAHNSAIFSVLPIDNFLIASGDDDGYVKIWDFRQQRSIMENHCCEEYISDMKHNRGKNLLFATSGEGTLTTFNIRKKKMEMQSELFTSELLSLAIVKNEHKIVCGSGEGVLYFFNWGEWSNMSDRFPGHPETIETIIPIDEDVICTGSADGFIRVINLFPHRFVGIIGEHNLSVDQLCTSSCDTFLVSSGQDECIKFWKIGDMEIEIDVKAKAKKTDRNKRLNHPEDNFFADLIV